MRILILLLSLAGMPNSSSLEDLIKEYNWRIATSEKLKQLFSQTKLVDLRYLPDNSMEIK